jgi:hypothetical protein
MIDPQALTAILAGSARGLYSGEFGVCNGFCSVQPTLGEITTAREPAASPWRNYSAAVAFAGLIAKAYLSVLYRGDTRRPNHSALELFPVNFSSFFASNAWQLHLLNRLRPRPSQLRWMW